MVSRRRSIGWRELVRRGDPLVWALIAIALLAGTVLLVVSEQSRAFHIRELPLLVAGGKARAAYSTALGQTGMDPARLAPAHGPLPGRSLDSTDSDFSIRLTGQRPLDRANAPDAWERAALAAMESEGSDEVSEQVEVDGVPTFRFIGALRADASCAPCHGAQGVRAGGVLGGISISVDMSREVDHAEEHVRLWRRYATALWVLGVFSTVLGVVVVQRNILGTRDSEQRYHDLFQGGSDPAFVVGTSPADGRSRFLQVNQMASRLLGFSREELESMGPADVFVASDLERPSDPTVAEVVGEPSLDHTEMRTADGRTIPVERTRRLIDYGGESAILLVARDIRELRRAQETAARRMQQLEALTRAVQAVNSTLELRSVLVSLLRAAMEITDAERGFVWLVGPEGLQLFERLPQDRGTSDAADVVRTGEVVAARVLERRSPCVVNGSAADSGEAAPGMDGAAYQVLGMPIADRSGAVFGILEIVLTAAREPFEDGAVELLKGLTSSAAVALENTSVMDDYRATKDLLMANQSALRDLARRIESVSEQERQALATNLHDGVSQSLALLRMRLGLLAEDASGQVATDLDEANRLLDAVIAETRSLTFAISPPMLRELGLGPALEWLCETYEAAHGFTCAFEASVSAQAPPIGQEYRSFLYRSTRELLNNVVKHAGAKRVSVRLTVRDGLATIVVTDDGVGAPRGSTEKSGFGLFSIHERATAMGGSLRVTSRAGRGTRAELTTPLPEDV